MAEIIPLKNNGGKRRCPLCGKPEAHQFRPFCSRRCADLDLGKWLNEDYRIETAEEGSLDGENDGGD